MLDYFQLRLHYVMSFYIIPAVTYFLSFRYTDDMELDDAVHTAILTLKEG